MRTNQQPDAEALLRVIADVQAAIEGAFTPEERAAAQQATLESEPAPVYATDDKVRALEDFALSGAAESLELLAGQLDALVQQKMDGLYVQALEIYYAAVELARDPEHAHLQAEVEKMRASHIEQYGRPIPPRQ
jgi:hypothetical protein